ncbi:MAG: hypothetical protein Q8S31_05740 [Alphaproteobacteria bacterium]|nr:hypothetical protein [Alphaproteobacteria bacterium]
MKIVFCLAAFFLLVYTEQSNAMKPNQELMMVMSQKFYTKNADGTHNIVPRDKAIELVNNSQEVFTTSSDGKEALLKQGSPEFEKVLSDKGKIDAFNKMSKDLYGKK